VAGFCIMSTLITSTVQKIKEIGVLKALGATSGKISRLVLIQGFIVGVFGQLGDLAESLLKRDAGVKDSSPLIPGHGGALDRFDSLLFVSPLVFFYLDFIVFSQW